MKVAIVGSRNITAEIPESCVPEGVTEIISGAAKGIDTCAREFARKHHIFLTANLDGIKNASAAA